MTRVELRYLKLHCTAPSFVLCSVVANWKEEVCCKHEVETWTIRWGSLVITEEDQWLLLVMEDHRKLQKKRSAWLPMPPSQPSSSSLVSSITIIFLNLFSYIYIYIRVWWSYYYYWLDHRFWFESAAMQTEALPLVNKFNLSQDLHSLYVRA